MEKRCRDCKYYHTTRFGEYPCIDCMGLSHWQSDVVQKQEQKDILVFKFNVNFSNELERTELNKWAGLLEQMRDKGIIILPNYIDLVTMLPGDVNIKIYNSEGEELCLEQKKL
jgi:hypothetical protein